MVGKGVGGVTNTAGNAGECFCILSLLRIHYSRRYSLSLCDDILFDPFTLCVSPLSVTVAVMA